MIHSGKRPDTCSHCVGSLGSLILRRRVSIADISFAAAACRKPQRASHCVAVLHRQVLPGATHVCVRGSRGCSLVVNVCIAHRSVARTGH